MRKIIINNNIIKFNRTKVNNRKIKTNNNNKNKLHRANGKIMILINNKEQK